MLINDTQAALETGIHYTNLKASDTVDHEILLKRHASVGLSEQTVCWLQNDPSSMQKRLNQALCQLLLNVTCMI